MKGRTMKEHKLDQFEIIWPPEGSEVHALIAKKADGTGAADAYGRGVLIASGRAPEGILAVTGTLTSDSDHPLGDRTIVKPLQFFLGRNKSPNDQSHYYRWWLLLMLEPPNPNDQDPYPLTLTVTAFDENANKSSYDRSFSVTFQDPRSHEHVISIADPTMPGNISNPDDFAPYGPLADCQLGEVTMTDQFGTIYCPLQVYSDCTDFFFWSAQFPSLATQMTYTLHATDTCGGSD